jgi:outer membrane murein-binding lipoprotein Lpp
MQPDQHEYPIDYLNQIASPEKKPLMNSKVIIVIIGILVILAAVVGFLTLASSGGASDSQKLQTLSARMQTLQKISDTSEKSIKSSKLSSANSTLTLFLTNANRDIETPLLNNNIKPNALDKKIVAKEDGSELKTTLEDARLNATFDRVYAREMGFQLNTLASLMKEIYTSTKSKSLKDFLVITDANMKPIRTQLSDFNSVAE